MLVEGTGEALVEENENHKWKFPHGMTPEDIVLFKLQVHSLFNLVTCDLSLTLFTISLALIPSAIIPNTRNDLMGRLVNLQVRVNTTGFSCQWRNEKRKL